MKNFLKYTFIFLVLLGVQDFAEASSYGKKGAVRYTCNDTGALNYDRFGRHDASLCRYANSSSRLQSMKSSPNDIVILRVAIAHCPVSQYSKIGDRDNHVLSYWQGSESVTSRDILRLQKNLTALGFNPSSNQDGIFGPKTALAVKKFQAKFKKQVLDPWKIDQPTGNFYQSTRWFMNNYLGCSETVILDNGIRLVGRKK